MPASIVYMLPAFIIVLSVVVFIHEMGHYLAGRMCGVGVKAFSIGFGRELFGWTDRQGTRWKFCLVPLGGYVKFAGDMNPASQADPNIDPNMPEAERKALFQSKSVLQRMWIVGAGPLANFVLAIVIFAGIFYLNGRTLFPPVVTEIIEGGAAEEAGLLAGDLVVSIDDEPVASFSSLQRYISVRAEIPVRIAVERDGETLTFDATPKVYDTEDGFGNPVRYGLLGVRSAPEESDLITVTYGPLGALVEGTRETGYTIQRTVIFLGELITGRQEVNQLGGPVRIARMSGQVATLGVVALISFVALLSVSIGFLNLLPIPVLDGGHLLFYAIEALRGKPLGPRASEIAFGLGLTTLLAFMLFVTTNDLWFYGQQLVEFWRS